MVQVNNLLGNKNIKTLEQKGCFAVLEHQDDMSLDPFEAMQAYFMSKMNVKRRQVLCALNNSGVRVQAGAMQWMSGSIEMDANIGGVGGFIGKTIGAKVSGETAVKPVYRGSGYLMLEPTFKYLLLEDVGSWGQGLVLDDGLFLGCEEQVQERVVGRQNFSSAILGGKGLFNLMLSGSGMCVLESPVPREELIEFVLDNDQVKIDGNMAIAWSGSLQFTVEKASRSILGSYMSNEGFVNVYRGSGKILMAPTISASSVVNPSMSQTGAATQTAAQSVMGAVKNSIKL